MRGTSRYVILAVVSIVTIFLDQISKVQIMQTMRLHESIPIIPNFFSITYIRNPGAAFGILASSSNGFRLLFFGFASLFALVLLGGIFFHLRQDEWVGHLSIAAIVGGAIGNLLDRVRFGEVIDFLDVYIMGPDIDFYIGRYHLVYAGPYHWPAFNVADAAISVGVCFLMAHFVLEKKKEAGPVTS